MGVQNLMKLIHDQSSKAISHHPLESYHGNTVVCDATTAMYRFMVILSSYSAKNFDKIKDKKGNTTAHLLGLWTRTIHYLDHGIKPVWVFEGSSPHFDSGEKARQSQTKDQPDMEEELAAGHEERTWSANVKKIRITEDMKDEAKKMLKLMGLPYIEAPGQAEAQCAAMVKSGKAFATIGEDMDHLAFGTPKLLKGFKGKGNNPISEIIFEDVLKELDLTKEQFIDLCILCGTDFNDKILSVGPITAFKMLKKYGSLEKIIDSLDEINQGSGKRRKITLPKRFNYKEVRKIFENPKVIDPEKVDLTWEKPKDSELKKFMCDEKGFDESRIDLGVKRLLAFDREAIESRFEQFYGKRQLRERIKKFNPKEKEEAGGKPTKMRKSRSPSPDKVKGFSSKGHKTGGMRAKSARAR